MNRLFIWLADNGNIRKWQSEPFTEGVEYVPATALTELQKRVEAQSVGWRKIETDADVSSAPWDGKPVLIYTNHNWGGQENRIHRARWTDSIHGMGIFGWVVDDNKFGPYALRGYTLVTHWMPLPAAPGSASPLSLDSRTVEACAEDGKATIATLGDFALHTNWELSYGPENDEESPSGWRVHQVSGGINDREWTLLGFATTPSEAGAK